MLLRKEDVNQEVNLLPKIFKDSSMRKRFYSLVLSYLS